eukprot:g4709.t1
MWTKDQKRCGGKIRRGVEERARVYVLDDLNAKQIDALHIKSLQEVSLLYYVSKSKLTGSFISDMKKKPKSLHKPEVDLGGTSRVFYFSRQKSFGGGRVFVVFLTEAFERPARPKNCCKKSNMSYSLISLSSGTQSQGSIPWVVVDANPDEISSPITKLSRRRRSRSHSRSTPKTPPRIEAGMKFTSPGRRTPARDSSHQHLFISPTDSNQHLITSPTQLWQQGLARYLTYPQSKQDQDHLQANDFTTTPIKSKKKNLHNPNLRNIKNSPAHLSFLPLRSDQEHNVSVIPPRTPKKQGVVQRPSAATQVRSFKDTMAPPRSPTKKSEVEVFSYHANARTRTSPSPSPSPRTSPPRTPPKRSTVSTTTPPRTPRKAEVVVLGATLTPSKREKLMVMLRDRLRVQEAEERKKKLDQDLQQEIRVEQHTRRSRERLVQENRGRIESEEEARKLQQQHEKDKKIEAAKKRFENQTRVYVHRVTVQQKLKQEAARRKRSLLVETEEKLKEYTFVEHELLRTEAQLRATFQKTSPLKEVSKARMEKQEEARRRKEMAERCEERRIHRLAARTEKRRVRAARLRAYRDQQQREQKTVVRLHPAGPSRRTVDADLQGTRSDQALLRMLRLKEIEQRERELDHLESELRRSEAEYRARAVVLKTTPIKENRRIIATEMAMRRKAENEEAKARKKALQIALREQKRLRADRAMAEKERAYARQRREALKKIQPLKRQLDFISPPASYSYFDDQPIFDRDFTLIHRVLSVTWPHFVKVTDIKQLDLVSRVSPSALHS